MRRGGYKAVGLGLALALLSAVAVAGQNRADAGPRLYAPDDLPAAVAKTRRTLLAAAQSGELDRLRPLLAQTRHFRFSYSVEPDPIGFWADIRARRGGRQVLRALAQVLALPAARRQSGAFVWPYLATLPAQPYRQLSPTVAADVSLLMTRERWNARGAKIGYAGYRLTIDPDGTWMSFLAGD